MKNVSFSKFNSIYYIANSKINITIPFLLGKFVFMKI